MANTAQSQSNATSFISVASGWGIPITGGGVGGSTGSVTIIDCDSGGCTKSEN